MVPFRYYSLRVWDECSLRLNVSRPFTQGDKGLRPSGKGCVVPSSTKTLGPRNGSRWVWCRTEERVCSVSRKSVDGSTDPLGGVESPGKRGRVVRSFRLSRELGEETSPGEGLDLTTGPNDRGSEPCCRRSVRTPEGGPGRTVLYLVSDFTVWDTNQELL